MNQYIRKICILLMLVSGFTVKMHECHLQLVGVSIYACDPYPDDPLPPGGSPTPDPSSGCTNVCDEDCVNYNDADCNNESCEPTSVNYEEAYCISLCNPTSPNYDEDGCEVSNCIDNSPNYSDAECNRSSCDQSSPNYESDYCASLCDNTSNNYDIFSCFISKLDPSSISHATRTGNINIDNTLTQLLLNIPIDFALNFINKWENQQIGIMINNGTHGTDVVDGAFNKANNTMIWYFDPAQINVLSDFATQVIWIHEFEHYYLDNNNTIIGNDIDHANMVTDPNYFNWLKEEFPGYTDDFYNNLKYAGTVNSPVFLNLSTDCQNDLYNFFIKYKILY